MSNLKDMPAYSIDLIKELDEAFPPRCIQRGETFDDAMFYAGKRALVDFLIGLQKTSEARAAKQK